MALSSLDAARPTLPDRRLDPPERPAEGPKVETPITPLPESAESVDRRARAARAASEAETQERDPRDESAARDELQDEAVQIARSEAGYERIRDAVVPHDARRSLLD